MTHYASCGVVNIYNAGVVTHVRRIGSFQRLLNLQLQRQRCSRLERFSEHKIFLNALPRVFYGVVNIYNATSSLVHFEKKNLLIFLKNALAYYSASVVCR
jgi:hypothetical protein